MSGPTGTSLQSTYYSVVKAPYGFPLNPSTWSYTLNNSTNYTTASTSFIELNPRLRVNAPIGIWNANYSFTLGLVNSIGAQANASYTIDTAVGATGIADFYGETLCTVQGTNNDWRKTVLNSIVSTTSKTSYIFSAKCIGTTTLVQVNPSAPSFVSRWTSSYL
jgi:hypothetical protein